MTAAAASRPAKRSSHLGYIYIGVAAVFWGISASLGRAAFTGRLLAGSSIRDVSPLVLSQARTTFSCLVVLFALLMRRGWRELRLPGRDLLRFVALGLGGVAASNYFYYLAIERTNVATAIIVQYTAPVWVLLYMIAHKAEHPSLSKIASVVLAIMGIALVIGLFGQGRLQLDPLGIMAAMLAAFSFSFYNIGGHYLLAKYDRWIVLLFTTTSASLFWMCVNPPTKIVAAHYSSSVWLFLLSFAMLSLLIPFSFYFAGLQHLEPTRAIVASCLEPVFTVLIAAIALKEVVRPLQGLGIAMVLCAILVAQMPTRGGAQPVEPVD